MTSFLKIFLVAVFVVPFFGSTVLAQRPFEKLQRGWDEIRPRGRILREIFGDREQKEQKNLEQQQAQGRNNRNRKDRQPTPARTRSSEANSGKQAGSQKPQADPRSSNAPATKHPSRLGVHVKENQKSKGLLVDQIDQRGAAWLAGIRRGDLIVSVGGLETASKDDIESITSVMKDGDQIEFEVVRRGKKEKLLVQFGDLPTEDEELEIAPPFNNRGADKGETSRRSAGGRIGDVVVARQGINGSAKVAMRQPAPTRGDSRLKSVLDRQLRVPGNQPNPNAAPGQSNQWQVQPPSANGIPRASAGSRQVDSRVGRMGSDRQQPGLQPVPAQRQPARDLNRMRSELEQQQRQIELLEQKLKAAQSSTEGDEELATDSLLDFSK